MFNKIYYKDDNILTSVVVHPTFNELFESTTVTSDSSTFTMAYDSTYPTILDSSVYQPTNVIIDSTAIKFKPDTTTVIDFVLYDDYMKLCCEDLCTTNNIFKLNNFEFTVGGYVNSTYTPDALFLYTQKNPLTNNVIYDYVENIISGQTLYATRRWDLIVKREMVGYVNDQYIPEYMIKCIDSSGGVDYKNILLTDLGLTSSEGILTSTFYVTDTTTSVSLDLWKSSKNIAVLFQSEAFKSFFKSLRTTYAEVRLLFKIKNWSSTDNITIEKNKMYFNLVRGCVFYYNTNLDNVNTLALYSSLFLNRGMYFKYTSSDIEKVIKQADTSILLKINDIQFETENYTVDKTLLTSVNYFLESNIKKYVPLEIYGSQDNVLSLTLKDLSANVSYTINNDMKATLMRQITSTFGNSTYYNPANTSILLDNFEYKKASYRTDFTNTDINIDYVETKKFNMYKTDVYSVNISDITSILDNIDNDISINIFWRKISPIQSYLYIQFKNDVELNYLRRYLSADVIDLILEGIILSITKMDLSSNSILLDLLTPPTEHVNRYSDSEGTLTYMYLIKDMEILSVNGVYNRSHIEESYSDQEENNTIYYVPSDVVIISNNKT